MGILISLLVVVVLLGLARESFINAFKIAYYEAKLENRGVDIEMVKNIGLIDILKL